VKEKIPSERTPQVLLCKDKREVNNAEAVTLCNGVNDTCEPANCTGNLKCNHIINLIKSIQIHLFRILINYQEYERFCGEA